VETFCDRAREALKLRDPRIEITSLGTETAYLNVRKLPLPIQSIMRLVRYRARGRGVVWLHYVNLPDLGYLALARLLGFKVMVTPHLGTNWRSQTNPALRGLSRLLLRFANRIALLARTQEEEIALPEGVPRSLIRTFLPAQALTPQPDAIERPRHLRLLHAGRLSEGKGSFLMLDVCAQLRDACVAFTAQIIGSADEETYARLKAIIIERNLEKHVEMIGWTPPSVLIEHLREADILVHLSKVDSYPLIVLEALASETLPVAMDLAGARDMIESYDGATVTALCPADDTASYLMRADVDDVRQRGACEAKRVRADFAWDEAAASLVDALGTL
jgi:glycosyltransferase involved in cell wall biosynthesis